ncbi:MAG: histidine-type phosphatase, partial [Lachnospiraceae bacterium]|nr:histidine-type phosphatase [Lachnospiraceae bacterium]
MTDALLIICGIFYSVLCVFSIVTGSMYALGKKELNPLELSDRFMEKYKDPEKLKDFTVKMGLVTVVVGIAQGITAFSLIRAGHPVFYWIAVGFTVFSLVSVICKLIGKRGIFPIVKCIAYVLVLAVLLFGGVKAAFYTSAAVMAPVTGVTQDGAAQSGGENISYDGYKLEQVVILSRHNIRSPLSGGDSLLGTITPHEWFPWSSSPSELSLRGGVLETQMGQYFRKWAVAEELLPENYRPEGDEIKIYANSKQRTIATANYFATGMFPVANLLATYKVEYDKMDPVFTPQITFCTDEYVQDATDQIFELYKDTMAGLQDNYELITEVTDMKDSEGVKNGSIQPLHTGDEEFTLKADAEPGVSGSLKTACSVSDALVLQYYEESDPVKAGFGHELTEEQWKAISEVKDVYGDVLFSAPIVAENVAYPLVSEILSEMETDGRLFTFLCGHDSNVASVLAALGVKDYVLPGAIEKKTPIGCKLVFTKWSRDGQEY